MSARPDYSCLFTSAEREVAQRFAGLGGASKSLYVRLFQRKGPWFRVDGMLGYDEVGSGTPLWVRRRAASATALAAGSGPSVVAADIRGVKNDPHAVDILPSSPFAAPMGKYAEDSWDGAEKKRAKTDDAAREDSNDQERSTAIATEPIVISPAAAAAVAAADSVKLSPAELTVLHTEIQSALQELIEAGFLKPLPEDIWRAGPGLEAALTGVECCLRSAEIKTLMKRTGGTTKTPNRVQRGKSGAKSGGNGSVHMSASMETSGVNAKGAQANTVSSGGRRGMIVELRQRLAGQQTLWGAKLPLVKEIECLVAASVKTKGVDIVGAERFTCADSEFRVSGGQQKTRRLHCLVLVHDSPRLVFKRALRLLYLTCDTSALSSGRVGAASVLGAGAAGAISSWSPGLSVAFGKARYAVWHVVT